MKARGLLCVLLLGLGAFLEFGLSESLAARCNQTTANHAETAPFPAGIAELMTALH